MSVFTFTEILPAAFVSKQKMEFRIARSLYLLCLVYLFSLDSRMLPANASGNETDRLALLKFKQGITNDPFKILESWNQSLPFCNWFGITCSGRHQRVTSLVLIGQNLLGPISPFVGNLSFLRILDLQNNSFFGKIPEEVGYLFRLQEVLLRNNSLEGEIPSNLSHCSNLRILHLSRNNIGGIIPSLLGSLATLEVFRVSYTNLTGMIPSSLGNLSLLTYFSVAENHLVGSIPDSLCQLTRLTTFAVIGNQLTGVFLPCIFNISSLHVIQAAGNHLSGSLPSNMAFNLPNLQIFAIYGNEFSGPIPNSLCNASQLNVFDISWNNFEGGVPTSLGNIKSLAWLELSGNYLGKNSTKDLDFLTSLINCSNLELLSFGSNDFGGALSSSVANLSTGLTKLFFGYNQVSGTIPAGLDNLRNLISLEMSGNLLTGVIPSYFGKLQNLGELLLQGNKLSGAVPSSIGNLTQLVSLILSQNRLEGFIPSSIANCRNLQKLDFSENQLRGMIPPEVIGLSVISVYLDLSRNSLTGTLPVEVGQLKNINYLDISNNNLSGDIPDVFADCSSLEYLAFQGNYFQGIIPSSLASLKGLEHLDLSRNNLSGQIPQSLQNIRFLIYLNLSFNGLEGEVPTRGVFQNATAVSLIGNDKLCGGVQELLLPKCSTGGMKKGESLAFKLVITVPCVISGLFIITCLLVFWIRNSKKKLSGRTFVMDLSMKLTYKDLYQATGGFSQSNLIGLGSFGIVYKGFLNQLEMPVAVKVLNLEHKGASKSFTAECEALRNIRHRNLVKVLGSCSSIDYRGNDFKALIFEFMANGSLDKWLHSMANTEHQRSGLNLLQRLDIAIDVASALHYLHDLCGTPIIHCDIKPRNVLLDDDMVAHVSDFGLARLSSTINDLAQSQTSTFELKGTIGYAAPEYGMGGAASKAGDVYSYGILVLEMFSGKIPTNEIFNDGLNLHDFVKAALPKRLVQIVDPFLLPNEIEGTGGVEESTNIEMKREDGNEINEISSQMEAAMQKCLLSILEIGISCSAESPKERMNMGDVTRELHLIKSAFPGRKHYGGRPSRRQFRGAWTNVEAEG